MDLFFIVDIKVIVCHLLILVNFVCSSFKKNLMTPIGDENLN